MKYYLLFTILFIQSKSFATKGILEKIDAYRNPSDRYFMKVVILDVEDKKKASSKFF